jgi:hypothetical protein
VVLVGGWCLHTAGDLEDEPVRADANAGKSTSMTLPYEVARAMREIPETRYAKTPDGVHIAFQVVGDGPLDLVLVPGLFSQVEHHWDEPSFAHFLQYLATLILEAKLVELPGTDHLPYVGDSDSILDEAEEFFDGHPTSLRPRPRPRDRRLH